tara:strand:- start:803 stop:1807 length:1005 start_codon:yes stop_codon:yes gene_type:complete
MFRGGKVSSYGTGIASGLGRQGYDNGGEVFDMYESIKERIPVPEEQGLSTGDYLRIASAGLDILGRPAERGGFSGALAAASQPLAKLGVDLGSSIDARRQKQLQNREDLARTLTGAQAEFAIGKLKADKKTATEISLDVIDTYYNEQIANENKKPNPDQNKIKELTEARDYSRLDVAQGGNKASKFRILNPATIEAAQDAVADALETQLGRDPTPEELQAAVSQYLLNLVKSFDQGLSGLADGGRVNKADGGMTEMVEEDVTTETITEPARPMPMEVTYDQLRARLPKEIGDEIVNLLANSYEALADFAAIATQADVDNFNTKYGVELVLPQEA